MGLNQFHVSFWKWSRSQYTLCDFKFSTATLTKHDNQTASVWRWFPFTLKQQKNMFCSQLALSVTCNNTPRLSADDCLQDAGMLQPGISYSRAAAHFGFHRDVVQKLQKHYNVAFTFHWMWLSTFSSSGCNVKGTRCLYQEQTCAHPPPNCLCDILKNSWVMCNQYQNWSQPYAGSRPFATVDPVCRPTCHVAGEPPWIIVIKCRYHPRWRSHKSPPVLLIAESRFHLGEVLNMCGMRWSAGFVICTSSLLKPTNWQQLIKDRV